MSVEHENMRDLATSGRSVDYQELQKLARAAARRVAYQWPNAIEEDDLEQDIIVRLMETPGAIDRLMNEPDQHTRQAFMITVAHQVASAEMADYDQFSGNYMYDIDQVRRFLEEQLWLLDADKFYAEKADLEEGLKNLKERNSGYYAEIINRFEYEMKPDWTDKASHKRISRAVEALTEEMNRIGYRRKAAYVEGPGSRKAISNARAQMITRQDYSGSGNSYRTGENDG